MTIESQQPAPGFAKRAPNFGKVVALAESYEAEPFSRDEVNRAILFGMSHLAPAETKLLLVYTAFLGREDLLNGEAFVYPSNRLICAITNWGPSTLRRHRQALEHKGLIIRNLNRANRPANTEAVDLRPLLASIRVAQQVADTVFDAHRNYVAHVTGSDVYEHQSSARAPETGHLIQSQHHQSESVTKLAPPARLRSPRAAAKRPLASTNNETAAIKASASPNQRAEMCFETKQASGSEFKTRPTVSDKQAHAEIEKAVQLAPELAPYFREVEFSTISVSSLVALAGEAVAGLFPERNTASHTWTWAVRRHGWRAILGLVAALADPTVRDRYGFLGWVSKTSRLDFATNLRRASDALARAAAPQQAEIVEVESCAISEGADGGVAEPWMVILAILEGRLGKSAVNAWLRELSYHGIEADTLHLTARTAFIRDYVRRAHLDEIAKAARAAGLNVSRVEITLATS